MPAQERLLVFAATDWILCPSTDTVKVEKFTQWSSLSGHLDFMIWHPAGILCIGTALAFAVIASSATRAQGLGQITTCVEISVNDSPVVGNISRKRKHTEVDCDPQSARGRAFSGARANASNALKDICRARILGVQAVRDICAAHGLRAATGTTSLRNPAVPAGAVPIDEEIGIGLSNSGISICTVIRNLPAETVTSTQPAGVENGFCIFNNNRATKVTARARARCGVQCL